MPTLNSKIIRRLKEAESQKDVEMVNDILLKKSTVLAKSLDKSNTIKIKILREKLFSRKLIE